VIHCDLAIRFLERFGLKKKIDFKDLDAWLIEEGGLASNAQPEKRYYVRRRLKNQIETSSNSARMGERGKPAYKIVCEYNGWRLEASPDYVKRNPHLEKILSQAETSQRQAQLDVEAIDPVQNYPAYVQATFNLELTANLVQHAEVNVNTGIAIGDKISRLLSGPMQAPLQQQELVQAALQEAPLPTGVLFQQPSAV
jgi:hypothetical protein